MGHFSKKSAMGTPTDASADDMKSVIQQNLLYY